MNQIYQEIYGVPGKKHALEPESNANFVKRLADT